MLGLICIHVRASMGFCEQVVMGLECRAVSAREIKDFVSSFSRTGYN